MLQQTQPPPLPNHRRDDDSRSLASVPSLTGTGSTADTASVLSESSNQLTPVKSLNRQSLRYVESTAQYTPRAVDQVADDIYSHINYLGFDAPWSIGNLRPDCASRLGPVSSTQTVDPEGVSSFFGFHDASPRNDRDNIPSPSVRHDKINSLVETNGDFTVSILITQHSGVEFVDAAECEGEICYISQQLTEKYNITPKNGWVFISWRKLDGGTFIHTWCEVIEQSRIKSKACLVLGKDRKRRDWNDCETTENVIELLSCLEQAAPHRPPSPSVMGAESDSFTPLPKFAGPIAHPESTGPIVLPTTNPPAIDDSADSSEEVTDGVDSWSSSSDGSPTTGKFIEIRKEQIIGRIIQAVTQSLRSRFVLAHGAAGKVAAGSFECGDTPSNPSGLPSQNQGRKRKASDRNDGEGGDNDGNDHDDDDDDDISKHPNPMANDNKGKGKEILRYACPYFKYNPTKYQQWSICPGPGWTDIHRVKGHLYRKHRQPSFRCVRCGELFESELNYTDHQRAPIVCELGERQAVEGFDGEQERQLRSRKRTSRGASEDDKWKAVFQILFPHVPVDKIPSPFYEYGQPTNPTTNPHETLSECEEYILREIPLRLRRILAPEFDRDFQIIEQSLRNRAIECTKTIVASLFEEYRKLRRQDVAQAITPEAGASQDHAGPSSSQAQSPWPVFFENNDFFLDSAGIGLGMLSGSDGSLPIFDGVQLGDIPQVPTDPADDMPKESDSGYASNNPERPTDCTTD